MAIDKPPGWMLVPDAWKRTGWNLQAGLSSSIRQGAFWAKSRHLRFLRFVHRLDAETTGVLLLAKSPGAVAPYSAMFESRRMEKVYLAVVQGVAAQVEWSSKLPLAPDTQAPGRMRVDERRGKEAETAFRVLQSRNGTSLIEAHPLTGRTHQIRVHLAASGCPVIGDSLYGSSTGGPHIGLGLRAVSLAYRDPFTRRRVRIEAPTKAFLNQYGFQQGFGEKGCGVDRRSRSAPTRWEPADRAG